MKDSIQLDCSICNNHCCGKSTVKAPILLPTEVDRFSGSYHEDERGIFRIDRKPNG